MSSFSARLSQLRNERSLSQKELAEHLGLGRTTIANYEQDTRFPNPKVLCNIADFFNVSIDYLLGRTDTRLTTATRPLPAPSADQPGGLTRHQPLSPLARQYLELLLAGYKAEASQLVVEALKNGYSVKDLYTYVFEQALAYIGILWEDNRINIADEHYFTAATRRIMSQLTPYVSGIEPNGRSVIITSVAGELHDIGIHMVADFFELDGWETYYLGANTPTQSIVEVVERVKPDLLILSATVCLHVESAQSVIKAIRTSSHGQNVKIMVGGNVFNLYPKLWQEIGADGYSANAEAALQVAHQLVNPARKTESLRTSQ